MVDVVRASTINAKTTKKRESETMADYIDRQAAIAALKKMVDDCHDSTEAATAAAMAISVISQFPGPYVSVENRPPKPETDVIIACERNGYRFTCPAIYEDGKMLRQDSVWNWNEIETYGLYDEDADDYYIPEGWWENRQFNPDDVYNNPVDCTVTHWMPIPDAPEVE